ncbi:MAG TPA: TRAP transporter substrate-binding protein DctP, partial [Bacteroidota bacterium]|nr:TRAP transporter substrate-binding protein DctP [Bacteroidota bacterium]
MKQSFLPMVVTGVCLLTLVIGAPSNAQQYTLKFASLATEGSTWLNVMREYDAAVRKESGGRLGFRIYAGGVQGEDKDVMRKIRLGQLHSTGITGVGIGEISPKLRIHDAPFLFTTYDEVDYFLKTFENELHQEFVKNDYVLLGWAEVGFVYVLTNKPVRSVADM